MSQVFLGGCHCGAVRFQVRGPLDSVAVCNCSICTKKGFVHWIVAHDRFELLSGADATTEYRFNTGVARHTFCRNCGIHAFYVPRSDPDKIDVNVRCLDEVDMVEVMKTCKAFDGRNWETAILNAHWQ